MVRWYTIQPMAEGYAFPFYTLQHIFERKPFPTMTHRFVNTIISRVSNYLYFYSILYLQGGPKVGIQ